MHRIRKRHEAFHQARGNGRLPVPGRAFRHQVVPGLQELVRRQHPELQEGRSGASRCEELHCALERLVDPMLDVMGRVHSSIQGSLSFQDTPQQTKELVARRMEPLACLLTFFVDITTATQALIPVTSPPPEALPPRS